MNNQRPRKLKRGLEDLSPLFRKAEIQKPAAGIPVVSRRGIECMSVFNAGAPEDSRRLNRFLAARLAAAGISCSMISLRPFFHAELSSGEAFPGETLEGRFDRCTLRWDQWEDACRQGPSRDDRSLQGFQVLFLDFEYASAPSVEKIIPILDRWILFVRPTAESLHEAYKMMKGTSALNPHLEYFLLYDGLITDRRGATLFERFSEMVARRMGIHLVWLGNLHFSGGRGDIHSEFTLEHLFLKEAAMSNSIEKRALANHVRFSHAPVVRMAV